VSEKDLEQFNADVQENEAAAAAPVDNASPEAIGEAIKEINGEADASAAPEKADDELQVGVIKPIATGKPESKRALKKAEKKKAKAKIYSCDVDVLHDFFPAYSSNDRTRSFLKVQDGWILNRRGLHPRFFKKEFR
jgi:hypothetical protein